MSKRKRRKSKKYSTAAKFGLSTDRYKRLKKAASDTRSRIRSFQSKYGDQYEVPDVNDYTLNSLLERIANGESTRSILNEMRNINATNLKSVTESPFTSEYGYTLSPREISELKKAVNTANKNIRSAHKKYDFAGDIIPSEFDINDILKNAVSSASIANLIEDLKDYTPKNLQPIAINEYGEAGTQAELNRAKRVIERENVRREALQEVFDPNKSDGFFISQRQYDTKPLDTSKYENIQQLRKAAETWSDQARLSRANLFLTNYENTLDTLTASLINAGMMNRTVQERIKYIKDVIGRLYNNEKAITYASTSVPSIDIALLYQSVTANVSFADIYNAWTYIEDEFL